MKSKKSMLALSILVLVLLLGVGYAVVSSVTLTINGTAEAQTKDLEVYYDGTNSGTTTTSETAVGYVSAISSPDKTRAATFTVKDMTLNQTITMTFEVKNYETDVAATLATPTITNDKEDFFEVTTEYSSSSLAAGATSTVTVKVKLIKTPVTEDDNKATIGISFVASPVSA